MESTGLINDSILKEIVEKIRGISLGTITITIYNSKIVRVDVTSTETTRFDDVWLVENGGGI